MLSPTHEILIVLLDSSWFGGIVKIARQLTEMNVTASVAANMYFLAGLGLIIFYLGVSELSVHGDILSCP